MGDPLIRILLIQDNPDYGRYVKENLSRDASLSFQITEASTLAAALEYLHAKATDLILLEMDLPDSRGLATFEKIQSLFPNVPAVILTFLAGELTALRAVQKGAQDYLLKTEDESRFLRRVIRCTLERQRAKLELMNLSYLDDLTGLYNRRGFFALADQQIKLASRTRKGFLLMMMDLDSFKQVNDVYGHLEGDQALRNSAEFLKKALRQTDIISRLGGDEFAAIAIEASRESSLIIYKRLGDIVHQEQEKLQKPYRLSMSVGIAYFYPEKPVSFQELFEDADAKLYRQKRTRQEQR